MVKTHTTIQGETWDSIAKRTLGSEYYMSELIEANLDHRETVIFAANVVLIIPEVEIPTPEKLPPWKQVGNQ